MQPSCRGGHLLNYTLFGPSSSPVGKYWQGKGKISILGSFMKKDLPIQLLRTFLIPFTLEGAPPLPVSPLLRGGKTKSCRNRQLFPMFWYRGTTRWVFYLSRDGGMRLIKYAQNNAESEDFGMNIAVVWEKSTIFAQDYKNSETY